MPPDRWVERPGARLCVRRAPAAAASEPPLLLLHGFPDFWFGWSALIARLQGGRQDLLIPDLRGYNDSPVAAGEAAFDLETLVADVLAIADAYEAPVFDLMGHDWGGVIAWACAQRAPDRVRRLAALNAPHPFLLGQALATDPEQQDRSSYMTLLGAEDAPKRLSANGFAPLERAFASAAKAGARDEAVKAIYRAAWGRPGRMTAMLAYYRAASFLTDGGEVWRPKAPIPAPVLLIWGARDGAFVPTLPQAHHAVAPHLTLRLEPDLGHWPHQEDPDRIAQLWRSWTPY